MRDYNDIYEKSTKGQSTKRDRQYIRIKKDVFKKTASVIVAAAIGLGAVAGINVDHLIDNFSVNHELGNMVNEFHMEYVAPNTHRTEDNEHFYYDYDKIAAAIETYDNQDTAIYLCEQDLGSFQTGKVLKNMGYGSFSDYAGKKGFSDVDEYEEKIGDQIKLELKINEEKDELSQMMVDNNTVVNDGKSMGGK